MTRQRIKPAAVILLAAALSGCALGKAEFKVVRATPSPSPAPSPAAAGAGALAAAPAAETGNTLVAEAPVISHVVRPGESLWRISRRLLGDPWLYPEVARRNRIANPDVIQPGRTLTLDPAWSATPTTRPGQTLPQAAAAPAASTPEKTATPPAAKTSPGPAVVFPQRPNAAFKPGEKLTFSVEYFGIAAGFATLSVEEAPDMHGRKVWRLKAEARTHPAFEWFFKVRDRIESYLDVQGLFSWQYEKHLREGGYSNDSVIVYDQLNRQVVKDQGKTVVPAPAWTQDVLSEFYFYRTLGAQPGETVDIPVVADDGKTYEVLVTTRRQERVTVPTGTYDCIVVVPALKFEGLFQQKGEVEIWLTNDARRVPVLIKSKIVIGTIDIVLREAVVVE